MQFIVYMAYQSCTFLSTQEECWEIPADLFLFSWGQTTELRNQRTQVGNGVRLNNPLISKANCALKKEKLFLDVIRPD